MFDRGQILLNGHSIGYSQNEMTREGFAYANLKGFAERMTISLFIHCTRMLVLTHPVFAVNISMSMTLKMV